MKQAEWKRLEIGGGEEQAYPDELSAKQTDGPLRTDAGKRKSRGSGRTIHRRGNFSRENRQEFLREAKTGVVNEEAVYSMFNKEKYFPLVALPIPISHYCCFKLKKSPLHEYQKKTGLFPILATLAEESRVRKQAWIRHGCNAFASKNPTSQPMSFWTEQDVLSYIAKYAVPICSVYGDVVSVDDDGNVYDPLDMFGNPLPNLRCTGCNRTGCIYCAFGFHLDKGLTRFQRLALTHPRQYEYALGGGQWADNPFYDPTAPKYDGVWENWNPKKIWVPSKKGLGMRKVFEMVNETMGKGFYRYE